MDVIDEFYSLVDEGRSGNNYGLSMGLPKLETYIEGLTQGTSYLVAAGSGAGKSTLAIYSFIYCPIMDDLDKKRDVHYLYFSLEMTPAQILAKLMSIYVYLHYGKTLSFKDIFSRGKDSNGQNKRLNDNDYELIKTCKPVLEMFMERITFAVGTLTADIYVGKLRSYLAKFGTFDKQLGFIPNNSKQIIGVIVDHLNLVRATNGRSKKGEIDLISTYSVSYRNLCKIVSPINIMQLNRNSNGNERLKQDLQEPDESDIKETGSVYEDTQVALLMFDASKAKKKSHRNYDVEQLGSRYRSIRCLKNRFGASDIAVGTAYYGAECIFKELPKGSDIRDYTIYNTPDWILKQKDSI